MVITLMMFAKNGSVATCSSNCSKSMTKGTEIVARVFPVGSLERASTGVFSFLACIEFQSCS